MFAAIGDQRLGVRWLIVEFPDAVWTAPKDYPAETPLLFHVDNHGSNEYMLIEVNVL